MKPALTVFDYVRYDADIAFRRRASTLFEFLDPREEDLILDAGCGLGFYLSLLGAMSTATVVGVELEKSRISEAAAVSKQAGLVRGDISRLPFADAAFDKVLASEVLEHLPDDVTALREISRVLRPGGVAAISVPYRNYPFLWDPLNKTRQALGLGHFEHEPWSGIWTDHRRLYGRAELSRKVQQSGMTITDVRLQTRWSLPFSHVLIYGAGKSFVSRRGDQDERRRDAFWGRPPRSNTLKWAIGAFTAIDRLNRPQYPRGPAVSLCIRAIRPMN